MLGPIVLFVLVLLKLVLKVPLCDPVFDELLEFVLLGDAAVGTRCPYCKKMIKNDKYLKEHLKRTKCRFMVQFSENMDSSDDGGD